jgi:hypothetical protein
MDSNIVREDFGKRFLSKFIKFKSRVPETAMCMRNFMKIEINKANDQGKILAR